MLYSELREKEVISIKNCKKLGHVCDLEFDKCTGQIFKIIVMDKNFFLNFLNCDSEYVIAYKDIKQIGPDIILVDV